MTTQAPQPPETPHAVPSRRAIRNAAIARWALILLSFCAAVLAWTAYFAPDASESASARYFCPMHPAVVASEPGECPICHMALEPVPEGGAAPRPASSAPASASAAAANGAEPPGLTTVDLGLPRALEFGVRTSEAVLERGPTALRVSASVQAKEALTAEVRVRAAGFVESVRVGEIGGRVRKGDELVQIYSPEIHQAFSDFVLSARWADADDRARATFAAARRRVELLGVSSAAIERALEQRQAPRTVSIRAPAAGFVVEKNVTLGSYVTPETQLYRIVNLERVFVIADVPAADAGRVTRGQKARFVPAARPGLALEADVELIYPNVAEAARTLRLRLEIENGEIGLKPGEFGTLELVTEGREALWVPRDAVVDTGLERYVFVELAPGRYQPRKIETGALTPERIEIARGLRPGERVVSGATFLVDSESRLRAALEATRPAPSAAPSSGHGGHP